MLLKDAPQEIVTTDCLAAARAEAVRHHILTVNVEDYFQVGVFHRFIEARHWYRFDSRLQQNIELTLEILAEQNTTATFFVLGWIADKYPQLVQQISQAGHEIGSRGYLHQSLLDLERAERSEDLRKSKAVLEDITGQEVFGFRLSNGWLQRSSLGFLDELAEAGYRYDSSLLPRRRDFRNEPHRRTIHSHQGRSAELLEVPLSTLPVAGTWFPIAGGNYQRQLPNSLMRRAVNQWMQTETSPYVMYFQLWEMDSEQPRLSVASRLTQVRHYRNLDKYQWLLPEYLKSWRFTSVMGHAALQHSPLGTLRNVESAKIVLSAATRPRTLSVPVDTDHCRETLTDESHAVERQIVLPATEVRRQQTERTQVTLVIPCYNEEGSLPYLSKTLEHLKHMLSRTWDLRVLFVDDNSRDNTHELLVALFGTDDRVRIVHHEVNRGVSAAILTGLQAAATEIVCSIDCDCSYDPLELQNMLPLMKSGVAMVTASPYHRDGEVRNVPGWRLVLSHGLSVMYRILLGRSLSTWTSCFRVYRRSQILDLPLHESGFLGTAELAAQLSLHDRLVVEHPATLQVRLFGVSKMKTLKTVVSHLRLLGRLTLQRFQWTARLRRIAKS